MTGTIGSTAVISNFSLALLKDSGLVPNYDNYDIVAMIQFKNYQIHDVSQLFYSISLSYIVWNEAIKLTKLFILPVGMK